MTGRLQQPGSGVFGLGIQCACLLRSLTLIPGPTCAALQAPTPRGGMCTRPPACWACPSPRTRLGPWTATWGPCSTGSGRLPAREQRASHSKQCSQCVRCNVVPLVAFATLQVPRAYVEADPVPLPLPQRDKHLLRCHPLDCAKYWGGQDDVPARPVQSDAELPLPAARLSGSCSALLRST